VIRRLLPDLYEAVAALREESGGEDGSGGNAAKKLEPVLAQLATALDKGDSRGVGVAMRTLREMEDLNAPARELYFFLNDAHLMGETEKASAKLAEWMQARREIS
jgi:hypothetical protein